MTTAAPLADEFVVTGTFATIRLSDSRVVRVRTQFCGAYLWHIFNLGPCTVYYRDDADPTVGDPNAVTLPPGSADNSVLVSNGEQGLRFIAGAPCCPPCPNATDQAPNDATVTLRVLVAG